MSAERKPVDVLAVMDEMIDCFGNVEECPDDTDFLDEAKRARAAVANQLAELTERRAKDALVAELVAAAGDLIDVFQREGETEHEKRERVDATFLHETGIHAPSNTPSPSHTNNERWDAYQAWCIAKRDRLNAALAALRGKDGAA